MKQSMDDYRSRMHSHAAADVHLTHADRRALESLGYLGGGTNAGKSPAAGPLPDIKDMLPLLATLIHDVVGTEAVVVIIPIGN